MCLKLFANASLRRVLLSDVAGRRVAADRLEDIHYPIIKVTQDFLHGDWNGVCLFSGNFKKMRKKFIEKIKFSRATPPRHWYKPFGH